MEQHRVVITGMGIYSCLGTTLDEVRDSLYNGKSGIVFDPERKEMGFRSALTAKLIVPDLKKELSRSQRVFMPEQAKYAYCATRDALRDAGIDQDYLNTHEVGLLYGNDSSTVPVVNAVDIMREKKDTTLCGSGAIFQSMNSTVTMNLGCIFKLKGINLTVSGACASGSHAIDLEHSLSRTDFRIWSYAAEPRKSIHSQSGHSTEYQHFPHVKASRRRHHVHSTATVTDSCREEEPLL